MRLLNTRIWCTALSAAMFIHGPAAIAIAMPAPAPQPRFVDDSEQEEDIDPVQQYHDVYQSVFERLFQTPYDPSYWTYSIDSHVDAPGQFYGSNQYGQLFTLDVLVAADTDLLSLPGITDSQKSEILTRQLQMSAAVGTLNTPLASIAVNGNVISSLVNGVPDHRFVITHEEDPNSALFNPPPLLVPNYEVPPATDDDYDTYVDTTPQIFPEYAHFLDQLEPTEEHMAVLKSVFETAFGSSPTVGNYQLAFDQPITTAGAFTGSFTTESGAGESYSLYAQSVTPLDVEALECLDQDIAAQMIDAGLTFHVVSGTLEGDNGNANITGVAVSSGEELSALSVIGQEGSSGGEEVCGLGIWIPIPVPYSCTDAACVAGCNAIYDAAVATAIAAYDLAISTAAGDLATAIATAANNLDFAKGIALAALTAGLALCAASQHATLIKCALIGVLSWWTGGGAFLLCLATVAAVYAACYLAAEAIYNATVSIASSIYNDKVAEAQAKFDAKKLLEAGIRDAAIADAQVARDACIAGCTTTCWRIVWIYIRLF